MIEQGLEFKLWHRVTEKKARKDLEIKSEKVIIVPSLNHTCLV